MEAVGIAVVEVEVVGVLIMVEVALAVGRLLSRSRGVEGKGVTTDEP